MYEKKSIGIFFQFKKKYINWRFSLLKKEERQKGKASYSKIKQNKLSSRSLNEIDEQPHKDKSIKAHNNIKFFLQKSSRMDQQQMDIQRISNLSNYSGNSQSHSRELNAKTQEMSLINTAKHLCGTQGEKKNGRGKDIENVEEIFNWFQEKGIYSGNPCELYERYTEQCREKIRLELKKSQITEDEPKSPSKLLMSRKTSIISNLSLKL